MMNFEEIALSELELETLRESAKAEVSVTKCPRLLSLMLIEEIYIHIPGYMGQPTGFGKINDMGINYLAYVDAEDRARKKEHRHNWLIAIFSTLGGALLSEPLWEVIHRVYAWICELL